MCIFLQFYLYRTQAGAEVDLLIKSGQRIWPVEIKLGIEVRHYDVVGLRRCMEDLGIERGFVVCRREDNKALGRGPSTAPRVTGTCRWSCTRSLRYRVRGYSAPAKTSLMASTVLSTSIWPPSGPTQQDLIWAL